MNSPANEISNKVLFSYFLGKIPIHRSVPIRLLVSLSFSEANGSHHRDRQARVTALRRELGSGFGRWVWARELRVNKPGTRKLPTLKNCNGTHHRTVVILGEIHDPRPS